MKSFSGKTKVENVVGVKVSFFCRFEEKPLSSVLLQKIGMGLKNGLLLDS